MVLSETAICNMALADAGLGRIGIIGEGKLGRSCAAIFEALRNEVLEAYPWRCAKGRRVLSRSTDDPPFGYSYAYNLPADCLKPLRLEDDAVKYSIENGKLLTNSSAAIQLHYIREITNTALFDHSLATTIAARMAASLALSVKQSKTLSAEMWQLYEARLPKLQAINESDSNDTVEAEMPDSWYNAR